MKNVKKIMVLLLMICITVAELPAMTANAGTRGIALYTAEDLLKMKDSSSSFYLANDIDMTEYGLWTPIGFKGTLDGNGYTISNMMVANQNGGLFSKLEHAAISNLTLTGVVKKGAIDCNGTYMDGCLAYAADNSTISGVSVDGEMSIYAEHSGASNIGGIIGQLLGTSKVQLCTNNTSITYTYEYASSSYTQFVGGLIGRTAEGTKVSNCYNTGDIYVSANSEDNAKEYAYAGGLVGGVGGKLYYSYNIGSVAGEKSRFCGIASFDKTGYALNCYTIENCAEYLYYWYKDSSVQPKCYTKTELELKDKATYAGWDFDDIWMLDPAQNDGYPVLITEQASIPTANYASGEYGKELSVTLESSTKDARIYYTLDGSTPTESSYVYYNPIMISKTTTLRAIAVANGCKKSEIANYRYTFKINAPKPSLPSGKYQGAIKVKLTCNTDGAVIYYTLDGSTPTKNSRKYTGKINIKKTTTLKTVAIKGDSKSKIVTRKYVIKK